ncbi:MAG: ATP-binding protein [Desulfuromonadales bacterium]|nr:ATP-binding protein [Desulfuromonadales bacterium]
MSLTAEEQSWLIQHPLVRAEVGHDNINLKEVVGAGVVVALLALLWIVQLRLAVRRRTADLRQEITLRQEKEKELKQSMEIIRDAHQRLRIQIKRMPLAYIVWDTAFRVVEWNPAAEKMFGWSATEAAGRHAYDILVSQAVQPIMERGWKELLAGDENNFFESEMFNKAGNRLVCAWYNSPLRDPAGEIVGVLSMVRNVTERRRAEEEMRMQLEQLSVVFDAINAVVYVVDLNSHELLYLNRRGESLFGADWTGKKCHVLLQGQNEQCSFCNNDLLVKDGVPQEPYVREFRNKVNGHWYRCIDRAIRWPDGRLVRVEIAFDITDNKQMEQLKDEMISSVSHEMRTPLTAILGYVEFLLENDPVPDARATYLKTIFDEAEKLNQMIEAFLHLQRHKARQHPPTLRPFAVRELLAEAVKHFRVTSTVHQFQIDCPEDLPMIRGDKGQLRQLFDHLLGNALKFSPTGGLITLGARWREERINLWVEDQGVGIPADRRKKVFERFYRVDNSDRRQFGGAGLGLTLVKEIVDSHDGHCWIESEEGRGTTVHVTLNVAD